ncbi:MAG: Uma2 family endonuclease [Burkholderiales bacterium]|nr:Uma2 family endonuclease [Phycisphaerae bacterium]
MALTATSKSYTVDEYFAIEERAEEKHEFDNGEIYAMSGGTLAHSQITMNVGGELRNRLRGQRCQALESNIKVGIVAFNKFVYPDVMVVCGRPEFAAEGTPRHAIVNPTLIVEVLSLSTELYDRVKKFEAYQSLDSLKEYVLVAQREPHVNTYFRHDDGRWTLRTFKDISASVQLPSLGIEIPMREIYLNVEFQPVEPPLSEEL